MTDMSTTSAASAASLPYHEPSMPAILVQTSFLLLLHVANWALDRLIYCGLVGQILVGVAWGTPGAKLLSAEAEDTFVQLGYLGLLLIVFEGGLSTSLPAMRANLFRSASVAATGIAAPIALSFVLAPMTGASYLACFAAGAALCSTSLGTTFTVIRACGLGPTRLGVVLTSAAMLDDVVGLVMVQVIANLGSGGSSDDGDGGGLSALTVVRPILVSIAFAAVSIAACWWLAPRLRYFLRRRLATQRWAQPGTLVGDVLRAKPTKLVVATAFFVGLATAATYAGTSNLFAAYIAGAVLGWWDSLEVEGDGDGAGAAASTDPLRVTTAALFDEYFHPALRWILQPYFFASVGFSIPIRHMFAGSIVWKGIVYGVLMGLAKLICGVWLVRMPQGLRLPGVPVPHSVQRLWSMVKRRQAGKKETGTETETEREKANSTGKKTTVTIPGTAPTPATTATPENDCNMPSASGVDTDTTDVDTAESSQPPEALSRSPSPPRGTETEADAVPTQAATSPHATPAAPTPFSLYPAAILGLAMVPRGEIGFLISSVASTNGVFTTSADREASSSSPSSPASRQSDIFLIVTWAIVLCTVFGPLSVGLLVRRVKRLSERQDNTARSPLGVWGVQ